MSCKSRVRTARARSNNGKTKTAVTPLAPVPRVKGESCDAAPTHGAAKCGARRWHQRAELHTKRSSPPARGAGTTTQERVPSWRGYLASRRRAHCRMRSLQLSRSPDFRQRCFAICLSLAATSAYSSLAKTEACFRASSTSHCPAAIVRPRPRASATRTGCTIASFGNRSLSAALPRQRSARPIGWNARPGTRSCGPAVRRCLRPGDPQAEPTIAKAINGGYDLLEAKCNRCEWKPRSIASRAAPAGITVAGNGHIFWASHTRGRILMCRELTPHGNVGGKVEYRGKQYSVILSIGGKWKWSAEIEGHTRSGSHRPRAARVRSAHLEWRAASPRGAAFARGRALGCGMVLTCDQRSG
jgi:hypothetical protein